MRFIPRIRIVSVASWIVRYGPVLFLCGAVLRAILVPTIWGERPTPQIPPDGFRSETLRVDLSWSRGDVEGPLKLQVAEGRPDFTKPVYEHEVRGNMHTPENLERGRTYYWRLEQGDDAIVAWFRTSPSGVPF